VGLVREDAGGFTCGDDRDGRGLCPHSSASANSCRTRWTSTPAPASARTTTQTSSSRNRARSRCSGMTSGCPRRRASPAASMNSRLVVAEGGRCSGSRRALARRLASWFARDRRRASSRASGSMRPPAGSYALSTGAWRPTVDFDLAPVHPGIRPRIGGIWNNSFRMAHIRPGS
jgi:hypothetical protein